MKLTDIIFWLFLISVALFYIFEGNDMHHEKWKKIDQVFTSDENTTSSNNK